MTDTDTLSAPWDRPGAEPTTAAGTTRRFDFRRVDISKLLIEAAAREAGINPGDPGLTFAVGFEFVDEPFSPRASVFIGRTAP